MVQENLKVELAILKYFVQLLDVSLNIFQILNFGCIIKCKKNVMGNFFGLPYCVSISCDTPRQKQMGYHVIAVRLLPETQIELCAFNMEKKNMKMTKFYKI